MLETLRKQDPRQSNDTFSLSKIESVGVYKTLIVSRYLDGMCQTSPKDTFAFEVHTPIGKSK